MPKPSTKYTDTPALYGHACNCRRGQERDNCTACEGTGHRIDFASIRARRTPLVLEIPTIPTRSPFDADNLVLYVQNDSKAHATIRACVQRLQDAIDNAADHLAKANKEWHDDPEADDHEAYHADSFEQFPRAERTKALRELLERHTDTINEGAGFWPEDFAKIKAGDFVRLTDGTPAVVTSEPSGGRIYVAYKTDIHGPAITKAAEWNEIESHSPAN